MADNSNQNQEPSLIGGHAQYVKGAAEVRHLFYSPQPKTYIPSP